MLVEKQQKFAMYIGLLITWAYAHGYRLALGEAKRSDEQAEINALGLTGRGRLVAFLRRVPEFSMLAAKIENNAGSGIRNSLHELKLAQDFDLFKDGKYLSDTESHKPLGEYWESLDPLCRWGGRFGDGNHYSLEHNGVK
jgi:hypothetical protein